MSGIYIHIPYCARKCDYCDFYSVVDSSSKDHFIELIVKELSLRKDYLPLGQIKTVYFGGGTPSLLNAQQVSRILLAISNSFSLAESPEITFEANPDDLNLNYLKELKSTGINRLSIGVQSFNDNDLKKLGRRHNAQQAVDSVTWASKAGFDNISIDLIYGLPYSSSEIWEINLYRAFELPVKHLSCYHLIYEDGTPLQKRVLRGDVLPLNEEKSVEQFQILQQLAQQHDFIHYEISNLAKEGFFSRHNTSYWQQIPYLGVGPSAHSFNGKNRQWNPKSIEKWRVGIEKSIPNIEAEVLSETDKINDYLLTSLRTIWGANLYDIELQFGIMAKQRILNIAHKYIEMDVLELKGSNLTIKPNHFLTSDGIIADFLVVE